jgi:hypothetical protein
MLGLRADRLKQQRPAGDRLAMLVGVGQADEQVSPVAHQRDDARDQPMSLWKSPYTGSI